jgi:hypothetical protein
MSFFLFLLLLTFNFQLSTSIAYAQCPVCIITVGGGMFLAQKLGIDDLLVSIWISGLNTVMAYWLAPKIKIKFLKKRIILSFLLFLTTLAYFQFTDQLGVIDNRLLGIDKIILGQTVGLLMVIAGNIIYADTKAKNHHRALFPYAKVIFPVGLLLLATLIFKFGFNL